MKRLFTFTLALSMLLTLLAGCGGDDSKTPDAANSPPPRRYLRQRRLCPR